VRKTAGAPSTATLTRVEVAGPGRTTETECIYFTADSVTIVDSNVHDCGTGIRLHQDVNVAFPGGSSITGTTATMNGEGINIENGLLEVALSGNTIVGNRVGLRIGKATARMHSPGGNILSCNSMVDLEAQVELNASQNRWDHVPPLLWDIGGVDKTVNDYFGPVTTTGATLAPAPCVRPPARGQIRVSEATPVHRVGEALVASGPSRPEGAVELGAEQTTVLKVGENIQLRLTPPEATALVGPPTITATTGANKMTATSGRTGDYLVTIEQPEQPFFDGEPIQFGPNISALSEALDAPFAQDLKHEIKLAGSGFTEPGAPILANCQFPEDAGPWRASLSGLTLDGDTYYITLDGDVPESLADGSYGVDEPIQRMLETSAAALDTTTDHFDPLTSIFACELIATRDADLFGIDEAPVELVASRRASIATGSLMATCPKGSAFCVDGCKNLATNPQHCGACSATPEEVCDGVDNDCDTEVDEGCPTLFQAKPGSFASSGVFGTPDASTKASYGDCSWPSVAVGFAARSVTGLMQFHVYCAAVHLVVNKNVKPYAYSVEVYQPSAAPPTANWNGSIFGGTGTVSDLPCPPNEVLIHVSGETSENSLGTLTIGCAPLNLVREAGNVWTVKRGATTMFGPIGSGTGTPFDYPVPDGPNGLPGFIYSMRFAYSSALGLVSIEILPRSAELTVNPL
jgi:hypothetical protein